MSSHVAKGVYGEILLDYNMFDHAYCRKAVRNSIDDLYVSFAEKIKRKLSNIENVASTVDIWSDRRMRGFMAVTVHYTDNSEGSSLKSVLVACERFTGESNRIFWNRTIVYITSWVLI